MENFMSNNLSNNNIYCRFCDSRKVDLWTSVPKNYYKCFDCNFISVYPLPTYTEINDHYRDYHDKNHQAIKEKNDLRKLSYCQEIDWILKYIDLNNSSDTNLFKVFDYGCSGGYFLDEIKKNINMESLLLNGYDRSNPAIKILKEKGYYIDFFNIKNQYKYDLIIIRGVIEHIVDFKKLFMVLSNMLSINGYLFITATPNANSPCATLYRHNWVQHHYPSHIQHFSSTHFDYLSAKNGLIRIASTDLYNESPYMNESDKKIFMQYVSKQFISFNQKNSEVIKDLSHAFYESMLTLLYRKVSS
jgi:2-polyprenyl-3-methyl-5-hydroxy-6-metoxy-1,4-benzoquinol methylase